MKLNLGKTEVLLVWKTDAITICATSSKWGNTPTEEKDQQPGSLSGSTAVSRWPGVTSGTSGAFTQLQLKWQLRTYLSQLDLATVVPTGDLDISLTHYCNALYQERGYT